MDEVMKSSIPGYPADLDWGDIHAHDTFVGGAM
jgi:hypothetical protein